MTTAILPSGGRENVVAVDTAASDNYSDHSMIVLSPQSSNTKKKKTTTSKGKSKKRTEEEGGCSRSGSSSTGEKKKKTKTKTKETNKSGGSRTKKTSKETPGATAAATATTTDPEDKDAEKRQRRQEFAASAASSPSPEERVAMVMGHYGYTSTQCHHCGKEYQDSTAIASLMQCSRCRVAYYCDAACFNAALPRHSQFCYAGLLKERNAGIADGGGGGTGDAVDPNGTSSRSDGGGRTIQTKQQQSRHRQKKKKATPSPSSSTSSQKKKKPMSRQQKENLKKSFLYWSSSSDSESDSDIESNSHNSSKSNSIGPVGGDDDPSVSSTKQESVTTTTTTTTNDDAMEKAPAVEQQEQQGEEEPGEVDEVDDDDDLWATAHSNCNDYSDDDGGDDDDDSARCYGFGRKEGMFVKNRYANGDGDDDEEEEEEFADEWIEDEEEEVVVVEEDEVAEDEDDDEEVVRRVAKFRTLPEEEGPAPGRRIVAGEGIVPEPVPFAKEQVELQEIPPAEPKVYAFRKPEWTVSSPLRQEPSFLGLRLKRDFAKRMQSELRTKLGRHGPFGSGEEESEDDDDDASEHSDIDLVDMEGQDEDGYNSNGDDDDDTTEYQTCRDDFDPMDLSQRSSTRSSSNCGAGRVKSVFEKYGSKNPFLQNEFKSGYDGSESLHSPGASKRRGAGSAFGSLDLFMNKEQSKPKTEGHSCSDRSVQSLPVTTSRSPGGGCRPSPGRFSPGRSVNQSCVSVASSSPTTTCKGWEKPSWAVQSPLRTTERGLVAKTVGDLRRSSPTKHTATTTSSSSGSPCNRYQSPIASATSSSDTSTTKSSSDGDNRRTRHGLTSVPML